MTKVLIIDDDTWVLSTIARVLRAKGYDSLTASDGRAGIQLFHREKPALVITDIVMPEQEGIETIRELRTLDPQIKILAMSGGGRVGNTDLLTWAMELGASATLAKPFDPEDLFGAIEQLLGEPA